MEILILCLFLCLQIADLHRHQLSPVSAQFGNVHSKPLFFALWMVLFCSLAAFLWVRGQRKALAWLTPMVVILVPFATMDYHTRGTRQNQLYKPLHKILAVLTLCTLFATSRCGLSDQSQKGVVLLLFMFVLLGSTPGRKHPSARKLKYVSENVAIGFMLMGLLRMRSHLI